jgi:hypothetical protein
MEMRIGRAREALEVDFGRSALTFQFEDPRVKLR